MTSPAVSISPLAQESIASLRLTPRGRGVLAAVAALLLCGMLLAAALGSALAARPVADQRSSDPGMDAAAIDPAVPGAALAAQGMARSYTVREGDTLWGLAVSVAPGADPRPVVDRIQQLNGMSGSALTVGERLWLPLPVE